MPRPYGITVPGKTPDNVNSLTLSGTFRVWAGQDERIGTELGMDQDEVLRLKQISGPTELFQEENFSPAWTVR